MTTLRTRHDDFRRFKQILKEQSHHSHDMVVPSSNVTMTDGGTFTVEDAPLTEDLVSILRSEGIDPLTNASGEPAADLPYEGLSVAHSQLVSKMPIPAFKRAYDFLREDQPARLANVVNHYLSEMGKNLLVRTFRPDDEGSGQRGLIRAFLSDQYSVINNLDVFLSAARSLKQLGIRPEVKGSLSERSMYVEYRFPQLGVQADDFVKNYQNPHPDYDPSDDGIPSREVYPSFLLKNSEVGAGAFEVTPRLVVVRCTNGIVRSEDALRKVHLGSTMDSGVVTFSKEVRAKAKELAQEQVREAVETFISEDYIYDAINDLMAEGADEELEHPKEALHNAADEIGMTQEEEEELDDFFARGRDERRVAIPNAMSAYAQHIEDPDRAYEIERKAWNVLPKIGDLDFDPEDLN